MHASLRAYGVANANNDENSGENGDDPNFRLRRDPVTDFDALIREAHEGSHDQCCHDQRCDDQPRAAVREACQTAADAP
jgi:hypothetical protein